MKTGTPFQISLLILLISAIISGNLYAREKGYIPGEVLVKFKDGTPAGDADRLHSLLKAIKKRELRRLNLHRLKLPKLLSVEEAVRKYQQDPNVEYAEPNYVVHALATIPSDTFFSNQWGLNDTNDDTDIDAPEAWDITAGSDSVLIAVIDSGVAYNHPDFAGNVWTNEAELNGTAGYDDDDNGYIDDFYGWDFIGENGFPLDLNGHGTHVAGIIAARGDNGLGITGVMWDAKIMAVRFLGLTGSGSIFDAIAAITYAYENGARIMNNSWGSEYYSQSLKNTIDQYDDALFVFSAGNTGLDNDQDSLSPIYPASYDSPNIISVAATNSSDNLAYFSSYGAVRVDLAAPGTGIYSTIPLYSYGDPTTVYPPSGPVEDFEDSYGDLPLQGSLQGWRRGGTNSTWAVTEGTGVNGSNSLEDSPGGDYVDNTFSWAGYMTPIPSSIKGKRYLLTFDVKGEIELNYDWFDITYSDNGSNWDWIDYLTGSQPDFASYTADYTSVAETFDSFYFGFRIDSDGSVVGDGVYIDNIKMTTQDILINTYSYAYYNGTSMAAPHVTGVAGLLLASNPGLTNLQLKHVILNSVDPVDNLSGKVLTGGRLNAYAALSVPAAPSNLSAAAVSDSEIDLSWSDNATNEDGFRIERKTGAAGTYAQINTVGQNVTTYSNTGLAASTTYYYRVRANNTNGNSAYSNEANDTTMDAAIPTTTTTTTLPDVSAGSGGGGGGGGGGGCFIATAAYGGSLPICALLLAALTGSVIICRKE